MSRCSDEAGFAGAFSGRQYAISDFADYLFQQEAKMTSAAIIGGRNMADTIRVRGKVVALFETGPARVIRVVHGDGMAAVFSHNREAGDIGWTIPDIDHVGKRDRPNLIRHVVIDILRHVQKAFVDPEQVLRLLRVTDDAFREGDLSFGILSVLATEDLSQIGTELAALNQNFQSGRNDKVVDVDAGGRMVFFEEIQIELFEHFRQAFVKPHFGTELFELLIRGSIHPEVIEQTLHISEFAVVPFRLDQISAAFPKFFRIDPECGENNIVLHVGGAQRLVIIVNERNGVL
jgi:hypothetical protein